MEPKRKYQKHTPRTGVKPTMVQLTAGHVAIAKQIGMGNISRGVRKALEGAQQEKPVCSTE